MIPYSTYALGNSVGLSSTLEMLVSSEDIIVLSIGISMISSSSCDEVLEIDLGKDSSNLTCNDSSIVNIFLSKILYALL